MSAADNMGGVSPEVSAVEHNPVPKPEYADCAQLATGDGPEEAIGMRTRVARSFSGLKLAWNMRSHWEGPLFTDEAVACTGVMDYRGAIEARSGRYAQRIGGNRFRIVTEAQAPSASGTIRIRSFATAQRICNTARKLRGRDVSRVNLVLNEERIYREAGNSAVRTENTDLLGKLSCHSTSQFSGGVRAQRGDGTGGIRAQRGNSGGVSAK